VRFKNDSTGRLYRIDDIALYDDDPGDPYDISVFELNDDISSLLDDDEPVRAEFFSVWRKVTTFNVVIEVPIFSPGDLGPAGEPFPRDSRAGQERPEFPHYACHAGVGDIRVVGDFVISGERVTNEVIWTGYSEFGNAMPDVFPLDTNHRREVRGKPRQIKSVGRDGVIIITTLRAYYARFSGDQLIAWEDLGPYGSISRSAWSEGSAVYWPAEHGIMRFVEGRGVSNMLPRALMEEWRSAISDDESLEWSHIVKFNNAYEQAVVVSLPDFDSETGSGGGGSKGHNISAPPSFSGQGSHEDLKDHLIFYLGTSPVKWSASWYIQSGGDGPIPLMNMIRGPEGGYWGHARANVVRTVDDSPMDSLVAEFPAGEVVESEMYQEIETHEWSPHDDRLVRQDMVLDQLIANVEGHLGVESGGDMYVDVIADKTNYGGIIVSPSSDGRDTRSKLSPVQHDAVSLKVRTDGVVSYKIKKMAVLSRPISRMFK
jgi:hypothetical protein